MVFFYFLTAPICAVSPSIHTQKKSLSFVLAIQYRQSWVFGFVGHFTRVLELYFRVFSKSCVSKTHLGFFVDSKLRNRLAILGPPAWTARLMGAELIGGKGGGLVVAISTGITLLLRLLFPLGRGDNNAPLWR